MNWLAPIDIYCERTEPTFWAEPINAISNASFIIAAFLVWRFAAQRDALTPGVITLLILLTSIGIGSFLFHTFANGITLLMDVGPIALFTLGAIFIGLRRIFGGGITKAVIMFGFALIGLAAAGYAGAEIAKSVDLNGSEQYAPALFALIAISALAWWKDVPGKFYVTAASASFFVSLIFRSTDMRVCETMPIGVHYFWHLINGITLGLILVFLITSLPYQQKSTHQQTS